MNLILGNNGAGKSSLLKAVALAALGPLAEKFSPYMLVRRRSGESPHAKVRLAGIVARLESVFQLTWQDKSPIRKSRSPGRRVSSSQTIIRRYDEEFVQADRKERSFLQWTGILDNTSPAFFIVGYGSTRRVDTDSNSATPSMKLRSLPLRHQRIQSLFVDGYPLVSLGHWLPELKSQNPGRYEQVCHRINDVLPDGIKFTRETDSSGEFLFRQNGALVPFAALSDGCRAFLGWVADMLYHLCFGCPKGAKLVDNCGIVLVDEIDLHLHPDWQRTVLPKLAQTFPNLQFIVTSHSPIVVGTLQRFNLWVCEPAEDGNGSVLAQKITGVHGLNADQILNTEYFGLESSRAPAKTRQLKQIALAAERNVPDQATAFLKSLVTSLEDEPAATSIAEPSKAELTKPAKASPAARTAKKSSR